VTSKISCNGISFTNRPLLSVNTKTSEQCSGPGQHQYTKLLYQAVGDNVCRPPPPRPSLFRLEVVEPQVQLNVLVTVMHYCYCTLYTLHCLMMHTCRNFMDATFHEGLGAAGESEHLSLYYIPRNVISKPEILR
jgi:hypothetical protein